MTFADLRRDVHWANISLPRAGLVTMHSGNASGVDRVAGIVLIKPSGIDYDNLRPEDLVALRLNGEPALAHEIPDGIASPMRPSVDTPQHLALYLADSKIGGIVHTHSNYATAWAAHERSIPCALTAIADEFGGDIPCAPYVDNQEDHIVRSLLTHRTRAPALLLGRHGVFTFDRNPRAAFKAAVMVEDVAKTMFLARVLGSVSPLPLGEINKWWTRYHTIYGQNHPSL